jgi:hypothetical protein
MPRCSRSPQSYSHLRTKTRRFGGSDPVPDDDKPLRSSGIVWPRDDDEPDTLTRQTRNSSEQTDAEPQPKKEPNLDIILHILLNSFGIPSNVTTRKYVLAKYPHLDDKHVF